jgi:CheY-like chemotaxis protein
MGDTMRVISPHEKFALLIVEADPQARQRLEEAAEATERFWSIQSMADGRFALEYLWTCLEKAVPEVPDIMIANTELPGLDGQQLTRQLRRYEELRGTFVAILSSTGGALEQDAAETAGCDFFLRRPESRADLLETLHAIANRCGTKASLPGRLLS